MRCQAAAGQGCTNGGESWWVESGEGELSVVSRRTTDSKFRSLGNQVTVQDLDLNLNLNLDRVRIGRGWLL